MCSQRRAIKLAVGRRNQPDAHLDAVGQAVMGRVARRRALRVARPQEAAALIWAWGRLPGFTPSPRLVERLVGIALDGLEPGRPKVAAMLLHGMCALCVAKPALWARARCAALCALRPAGSDALGGSPQELCIVAWACVHNHAANSVRSICCCRDGHLGNHTMCIGIALVLLFCFAWTCVHGSAMDAVHSMRC